MAPKHSSQYHWYSFPGSQTAFRWSESKGKYIDEAKKPLPEEWQSRAYAIAHGDRVTTQPRSVPAAQTSSSNAAALAAPLAQLALSTSPNAPATYKYGSPPDNAAATPALRTQTTGMGPSSTYPMYDQASRQPQSTSHRPIASSSRQQPAQDSRTGVGTQSGYSQGTGGGTRLHSTQDAYSNTLSKAPVSQSSGSGMRQYSEHDSRTKVTTKWDILEQQGSSSGQVYQTKRLHGQGGNEDDDRVRFPGSNKYGPSTHPLRDYVVGRVIEVVFVPPRGVSSITQLSSSFPDANTGMRRFVIVAESTRGRSGFSALPIRTYNGRGVGAEGVVKAHHTIIYSRGRPSMLPSEAPQRAGERPMRAQPLRVIPIDRGTALDPMSRLDFFDIHNIDNEYRYIKLFGEIASESMVWLETQYRAVWQEINRNTRQAPEPPVSVIVASIPHQGQSFASSRGSRPDSEMRHGREAESSNAATVRYPSTTGTVRRVPEESASGSSRQVPRHQWDDGSGVAVITFAEMERAIYNIRLRARRERLTIPTQPSDDQILRLAQNPQVRREYFDILNTQWRREAAARRVVRTPNDNDDDDDEEEGEEESSADDNSDDQAERR